MNDTERDNLLLTMDSKMDSLALSSQRLHDVIFDTNGNQGLCSQVNDLCKEVANHKASISKLWIAVIAIAGGGGGTLGVLELVKRLSGG